MPYDTSTPEGLEKQRAGRRKWYYENKEYHLKRNEERRQKIHKFLWDIKEKSGCTRCDEGDAACLEFHHIGDKEIDISKIPSKGWSETRILKELKKCIVICSNCHRKLHHYEKQ